MKEAMEALKKVAEEPPYTHLPPVSPPSPSSSYFEVVSFAYSTATMLTDFFPGRARQLPQVPGGGRGWQPYPLVCLHPSRPRRLPIGQAQLTRLQGRRHNHVDLIHRVLCHGFPGPSCESSNSSLLLLPQPPSLKQAAITPPHLGPQPCTTSTR